MKGAVSMDFRKLISGFFTVTCTSFTVIILLYCVLWGDDGISPRRVFELFAVCAVIGAVVVVTSLVPVQSDILRMGIYFAEVFVTVFLFGGGILRLFPFNGKMLLTVLGMTVAAYFVVMAAVMANEKMCSNEINQKIAEMKKKADK